VNLITFHSQPNSVGKLLERITLYRYNSTAQAEEAAHLHLDGLDLSVRASFNVDHLSKVLVVGAVDRCTPQ
jgi:hypothetical protein